MSNEIRNNEIPYPSKEKKINILQYLTLQPWKGELTDDRETIHTSLENPILNVSFTERTINSYKNQIIISILEQGKLKTTDEKIFDKNQYHWKIPKDTQWINLIKEIIKPKLTYCNYFENENIKIPFINFLLKHFKHNSISLVISNKLVIDVICEDARQKKLKY